MSVASPERPAVTPAGPRTLAPSVRGILIGMWIAAGLAVVGVAGAVWLMRDRQPPPAAVRFAAPESAAALPPLFAVPPFQLTDQNGRPFDAKQLAGHVWVADFVFTHCTTFCPQMTANLAAVQQGSAAAGVPDLRLVSFTVDPDRDTPPVLKDYARANGADPSRWSFLTGTQKQMWDLSVGMKLSVGPGDDAIDGSGKLGGMAGMQVMHSSHFLLVDKRGQVRGVYDFKEPAFLAKLLADAKRVSDEG